MIRVYGSLHQRTQKKLELIQSSKSMKLEQ